MVAKAAKIMPPQAANTPMKTVAVRWMRLLRGECSPKAGMKTGRAGNLLDRFQAGSYTVGQVPESWRKSGLSVAT